MDNSKQQKQTFLRNQIIEAGIDPESFMNYMGTIKNQQENIDLDNWTIDELRKLVQQFKNQIKNQSQVLSQTHLPPSRESKQIMNKILQSALKKQKIFYQNGLWDYELVNQQQCKTIQKVFKTDEITPQIKVQKWEVKTHGGYVFGIGATKQLWITLSSNFTKNPVQRTNSDFQWLREALCKKYTGSYIPPLSQLRAIQPEDKIGLNNRVYLIEQFINSLSKYDYLFHSNIMLVFLIQDHKKLTQFKQREKATVYKNDIGRIATLDGKFKMEISKNSQSFNKNASAFSRVIQQCYEQAYSNVNKMLSDLETIGKHTLYMSNTCGKLHNKYSKLISANGIQTSSMQTIMIYLNNLFSNIGKNIKQQIHAIKQFSDGFLKFSLRSWQEFILHDKKYQKQIDNYLTFKLNLIKKKQKCLFDVNKWELPAQQVDRMSHMNIATMDKEEVMAMMLPRENQEQEELRIWMAYINQMYEKSFLTLLQEEQSQLKQKFLIYIEKAHHLSNQNFTAIKQFKEIVGYG